jgi:hypothetical protein
MTEHEHSDNRIEHLLKQSLPPTGDQPRATQRRDLWPAMRDRLEQRSFALPWFDWALLAGVIVGLVLFPKTIPVLLYHL